MNIALIMLATGDLTPRSKRMKNVDYGSGYNQLPYCNSFFYYIIKGIFKYINKFLIILF